ncbi:MAG: tetratricopeptide repeat protein, partial [Acetobacteraceae bacterium]|nr:tetratricopeptide repeat protein [Acetobacteraceae bacterium]
TPENEARQAARAVEVLELVGTAEARQLLETLARDGRTKAIQEEAKAALERAHDAAPSSPGITANLADLYTQTGNASKALDLLTAEAGKQTPNPSLLAAYARAQVAAGKTADAIESYTRLVQAQPDDVGARQRLASLLLASNEPEHARSVIQEGLSRTPRNYQLMQDYVAIDLKAKGLDAALTTAERLADQAQDFPAARALRGDTFMLAQKYDQAAQAYAAAMEAAPSSLIASRQAAALAQSGHPDQASQVLSNWLRQNPNDTSIIELLASYDIAAHRLNDAKTHLEAVLEAKPRDAIAMNNLAWVYQQLKDPRARSLAQRAYVLMPGGQTADTLGWILTSEGDASTGLQLLRQAHADAANDPRIKYHLAVALKDVGQRDEAIKLLAPVVSSDVKFDEKPQAEQLMAQLSQKS